MQDMLKVTVVATGLGAEVARTTLAVVDSQPKASVEPVNRERKQASGDKLTERDEAKQVLPTAVGQEDYFDIPAFLRRQAD